MKTPLTMYELRRLLIDDSVQRKRWLDRFVQLIRTDERDRTLASLERTKGRTEA